MVLLGVFRGLARTGRVFDFYRYIGILRRVVESLSASIVVSILARVQKNWPLFEPFSAQRLDAQTASK